MRESAEWNGLSTALEPVWVWILVLPLTCYILTNYLTNRSTYMDMDTEWTPWLYGAPRLSDGLAILSPVHVNYSTNTDEQGNR